MMKIRKKTLLDVVFFLFICSLFDNIRTSFPFFGVCLLVLLPQVLTKIKKIELSVIWYIVFYSCFALGILWSSNRSMYSDYIVFDAVRIAECLCIILWISFDTNSVDNVRKYIKMYIYVMLYLVVKLIMLTPVNLWGTERLGETVNLQPTMLGLALGFGAVSAFYIWYVCREKKYALLMLVQAIISMLTGSRNGVIILLLGISAFYVFNSKGNKMIRNFLLVVIAMFVIYITIMNVDVLYNAIGYRFENFLSSNNAEQSVRERTLLKAAALNLFLKNPIYGAGTEGFRAYSKIIGLYRTTYSHCNYTEMLANYGVIGLILYYGFQVWLLKKLSKMFHSSSELCFALIVCGMILVSDYGYVSYYGIIQQFFIAIVYMIYKINRIENRRMKDV